MQISPLPITAHESNNAFAKLLLWRVCVTVLNVNLDICNARGNGFI
jgi:hypothetical protein